MASSSIQVFAKRYATVSARKAAGEHYTPEDLAQFVAHEMIGVMGDLPPRPLRALDPAVGDGALLMALAHQFPQELRRHLSLSGFDTSKTAVNSARTRLEPLGHHVAVSIEQMSFLDFIEATAAQDLFSGTPAELFDLLICNPPYVRTQVIGAKEARRLAEQFGLTGRIDLYQVFLSAIARVLRPGATAGIIVSNRILTTRSSATLRTSLLRDFHVAKIVDFGDTRLFGAAVLPAVLVLKRRSCQDSRVPTPFASVYQQGQVTTQNEAASPIDALRFQGPVRCRSGMHVHVRHGRLETAREDGGIWRLADTDADRWLSTVALHTHLTFRALGRIRVGVKTTADDVFISSSWIAAPVSERPELLRPLLTHHIAAPFRAKTDKPSLEILYPHTKVAGSRVPVDLDQYPRAAAYLARHRERLEARRYLRQAGRRWYEIWVPQDPELWALPKLVFPDIARTPAFFVDFSGAVVNGDCYWIVPETERLQELLWLAVAVANAPFTEKFYDLRFNNKLYAGRRRFMTQYVEHLPLPDPRAPCSRELIRRSMQLYEALGQGGEPLLRAEVDALVAECFGLSGEETAR